MNAMAPTRPTALRLSRVRLTAGPAAAGQARGQVRAVIGAWDIPVDPDVAVLLTSELVTNAITHEAGGTVTLVITCSSNRLRVDVHDTSRSMPVLVEASPEAETGRGLMLVVTLSDEWGCYGTPAGKAVYFTLAFHPDRAEGDERDSQGSYVGMVSREPPRRFTVPTARRSDSRGPAGLPRPDRPQCCLAGYVYPRVDVELLQDVRDVGRDGPPG
jgi:anti-sigma regulatory factor (Ser/Thr protein kinase)